MYQQQSAVPKSPQLAAKPTQLSYQTGFNADRQPINTGAAQQSLAHDSQYRPQFGSETGKRGAADLQKSQQMNNQSQLQRSYEGTNANHWAQNQTTRSELMQTGLSNQAKIYSDMGQRANDQVGLAAQLQEAQIRNRYALMQALTR